MSDGYREPYVETDDNMEHIRFTDTGSCVAVEMYIRAKHGETIEDLEAEFGLEAGTPGTEDHHLEWKILMAMGNISGLFDKVEELISMNQELDQIEKDILYGNEE